MLVELHIESLGVIDRATLRLGSGLTALTGETGAGKTMLVEAIDLVTGGRAESATVRAGATEARVTGRFLVGDDELILSRVIPAEGRSRAYIDGRPATAASLTDAAAGVVDLHGQHAHQSMLTTGAQRGALDEAGGVDLVPLREAQAQLTAVEAELAVLGGDERARAREIDLLRFQIDELDAAGFGGDVDVGEDRSLDAEEAMLSDAQAHREAAAMAGEAIGGEMGATEALRIALAALRGRTPFAAQTEALGVALGELDDIAAGLRRVGEELEDDPERLERVRLRRALLRELCRKYGDDLAEVAAYRGEAAQRLAELEGHTERVSGLVVELESAHDALRAAASVVGEQRRDVARDLAPRIERRLRTLAMPRARVVIDVGSPPVDVAGDEVQILLAANPGLPLLPLAKVASGGELSRTMLALRLELIDRGRRGPPATLVFDEVDAGVGGAAANAVGEALAALAGRHQVVVVTHLAQIAARADAQIVVDKRVIGGATSAAARGVDGDERIAEVARMLAGQPASASAREHAAELLGH